MPNDAHCSPRRSDFRSDLEGLRAVAVVLVVLYHARIRGFGGGYVGVDVFYVLSGLFITQLLIRERDLSGRIAFAAFYARRARRLLPAAMTVVAATVIASYFLLPPLRFHGVGRDAIAAALYVSNVRFAEQATDYLQRTQDPSPLLHFWSLAVEEQFYVVWPALVALALWRVKSRRRLACVVCLASAASLVCSLWLTDVSQPWAFFSLPTRAWELGLGALCAVFATRLASLPAAVRFVGGWSGLAMIGASAYLFSDRTSFPGAAALLPVVGSALVVCGGQDLRLGACRLLGRRAPRAIGRWSYSIYLWHWPLLILPAAYLVRPLTLGERLGAIVACVGLGALSYRLVENPLRRSPRLARPRHGLALGLACGAAGALAGVALAAQHPVLGSGLARNASARTLYGAFTTRVVPANLRPPLAKAHDDKPVVYDDGCHLDFTTTTSPPCRFGEVSGRLTVVLFGDSHAAQWFPALDDLARRRHWRLESLTKSACASVETAQSSPLGGGDYRECAAWHRNVLARLRSEHPRLIVVSNLVPLTQAGGRWMSGLGKMLADLKKTGATVLVLGDVPRPHLDVPVCLSAHLRNVAACTTYRHDAIRPTLEQRVRATAHRVGAWYLEVASWVCPGRICPVIVGNLLVYRDDSHLTTPFVRWLEPRLARPVAAAVAQR